MTTYEQPSQPDEQSGGAHAGRPQLASWGVRAVGYLVDLVPAFIIAIIFKIMDLQLMGQAFVLAYWIWLKWREGATGQTIGKQVMGTRLLRERDGQVVGPGLAIARLIVHILDSLACLLGWLWPLRDAKRQTFADKILGTVVVKS
ncbi:MAG: RDD family protein [Carbonactinosporaceae bacterium]